MWGTGKLYGAEMMAYGEGEFSRYGHGVRYYGRGANDMISAVGDKFNKAIARVIDFAGWDVFNVNDRFLVFAFAAFEFCFVKTK